MPIKPEELAALERFARACCNGATLRDVASAVLGEYLSNNVRWIPCEDRLPGEREPYLVFLATGKWQKGYYTGNRAVPWVNFRGAPIENVTHWAAVDGPHSMEAP